MASNITVDTLTKGSTTLNTDEIVDTNSNQLCKAWVNFNGTGTVAIRDSYNVSSITDNATALYTVNYITNMSNTDYSVSSIGGPTTGSYNGTVSLYANHQSTNPLTVSSVSIACTGNGNLGTTEDGYRVSIQVFGD